MPTPMYNTKTFTQVWDEASKFTEDWEGTPFDREETSEIDLELFYYLMYARYGNNPIANMDVNQWKFKVFSTLFKYGPTWAKRLDIQKKLRQLTEAELVTGETLISNAAENPNTVPGTNTDEELTYINAQRVSKNKRTKLSAYSNLLDLLDTDVTEEFLIKFDPLFKAFYLPENPLLYETDTNEGEEE